ncbi:response regulator [Haliovirga abyssi]|uniref:Response regulatory domain-containing protein n=1 Tax=Haliovirga abyssi TaxID=2996794 RepID=A0AAU9E439_9FUSO|nr:response regulator [Haliovirga abyssi]BDU51255.1 hypothetical protein HLVA_18240 [Haliovirga abyssi]
MLANILFIEGTKIYKELLSEMFNRDTKFWIKIVENIEEAKNILDKIDLDIVVLDLILPDGRGEEIVKIIREEKKDDSIQIIVITSETSEDRIINAFNLGIDFYFEKPFNPNILKALIERIYEKKKREA